MTGITLRPVDSWFFRSSRPFVAQGTLDSLFPPHSWTTIGAIRYHLARCMGWDPSQKWSDALKKLLGDGYESVGELKFLGPHLQITRKETTEGTQTETQHTLYRMPLHLLGKLQPQSPGKEDKWCPTTFLTPGDPVGCDLGSQVRLPTPQQAEPGLKVGQGMWITEQGLQQILSGEKPASSAIFAEKELWQSEYRVGLERHSRHHTALEGQLYSTNHIRMQPDCDLRLVAQVTGIPEKVSKQTSFIMLGGESRMAELSFQDWPQPTLAQTVKDQMEKKGQVVLILLSPLPVSPNWKPQPGTKVPDLPMLKIVSACIEKPVLIGGWDSVNRKPMPLRPYLPAGSVFFCEIEDKNNLADLWSKHGQSIGDFAAQGYGQMALGRWPQPPASKDS